MDDKKIGKKIRGVRINRGQTQAEFADEIHVNVSYVGKLERGEKSASLELLESIAEKDGISVGTFLTFEVNELFQIWESETKDLALEEKEVLKEALKQLIIALKPVLKRNK